MRVLHIIYKLDPKGGGPPRALAGLAPAQRRAGLDVAVVASYRHGADMSLAERLREHGIPVEMVGPAITPMDWHLANGRIARRFVQWADVVHIHALWTSLIHSAARAATDLRIPYIVRTCGMLDPWSLSQSKFRKQLYLAWRLRHTLNHAAALHFTCDSERRLTEPLRLHAPSLVEPNGVDLGEFSNPLDPAAFRQRFPEIGSRRIVLFLSRLHQKKGLDLLVPAFAKAAPADAVLVVAGPDPVGYQAVVKRLAEQHRISERVVFTGMLNGRERLDAFAAADLFVLPSYQENFGVAIIESLAAGTPVLISDQVNICDEIAAGGVGGVVPAAVQPLASGLAEWLRNSEIRRSAAGRARDFVRARYDWDVIASRWCGHYDRIRRR